MPASQLKYKGRSLRLLKCRMSPDLKTPTILVDNQWDYVSMWLKRRKMEDALFFWRQAKSFYQASKNLPDTSSPLTGYYAALNAAKAFLISKGTNLTPYHGISGGRTGVKASLSSEYTRLKATGVLPSLCSYFQESCQKGTQYSLRDILYNLPFVHRAFTLTYTSVSELFYPIKNPVFVRKDSSNDCWLSFEIATMVHGRIINSWDQCESDVGITDKNVVRRKDRFKWRDNQGDAQNLLRFNNYYQKARKTTFYIRGITRNWYVKKAGNNAGRIERSSVTLIFMAMHRISEIARYNPDWLARHFDSQHNWLLTEFINLALDQFIDEIAAELTGHESLPPGFQR